ncbi:hypothetical protein DRB96_13665 [Streptomyces sp. ICC1]|nr:hypothetical protein DRB89_19495 [Streptomyces sp. ICC4]AWZ13186.1 hypothetical protein DRB96_13665 [Streptomyces sp. ICC1]
MFVSAADPDYSFGLQVIREASPEVRVVCTAATLEKIEATWESKLQTWAHLGPDLASEVVIPELLGSDRFELEGHVFEVCGGHSDLAWRTEYVWQAEDRAVLGGAVLWSGLHAWTADTPTTAVRAVWDQVLDEVEELDPRLVVAGHAAEGAATDVSVVSSGRRRRRGGVAGRDAAPLSGSGARCRAGAGQQGRHRRDGLGRTCRWPPRSSNPSWRQVPRARRGGTRRSSSR